MKRITIGKEEYTIEFSLEATLYNECTEKIMDMITSAEIVQAEIESDDIDVKEKTEKAVKTVISGMADIPQRALVLFYAGLLEHHGAEGDGSVKSKSAAKKLMLDYMKENEGMTLYDIMNEMMEEIVNDHFFDLIGVEKMVKNVENQVQKQVKTPQDFKRKAGNN